MQQEGAKRCTGHSSSYQLAQRRCWPNGAVRSRIQQLTEGPSGWSSLAGLRPMLCSAQAQLRACRSLALAAVQPAWLQEGISCVCMSCAPPPSCRATTAGLVLSRFPAWCQWRQEWSKSCVQSWLLLTIRHKRSFLVWLWFFHCCC